MPSQSSPGSLTALYSAVRTQENGTTQQANSGKTQLNWVDSVTFGANVPGWRDLVKRGESATTTMSGTSVEARLTPGQMTWTGPKTGVPTNFYKTVVTGALYNEIGIPAGNPQDLSETEADRLALGKFNRRIYDLNHSMQGGVAIGELGQTIRMLKNPALGLRRGVDSFLDLARNLRRGRGIPSSLRPAKVAENLADAWLEVQFGWRPFMHDIRDAAKALHQGNIGRGVQVKRISASQKIEGPHSITDVSKLQSGCRWINRTDSGSYTQVIYRGAMRVKARIPGEYDAALWGLDLASLPVTAWELIPYSFLIDYFTNIGDLVLGCSQLFTDLAWCNRTTRKVLSAEAYTYPHPTWYNIVAGGSIAHEPAKYFCEKKSVSRQKYTGTLVPGLSFEIPGFRSLRWLNIAALIASRNADRHWLFD